MVISGRPLCLWRLSLFTLLTLIAGAVGNLPRATAGTAVISVTVDQEISPSRMVLDEHTGHLFVATVAIRSFEPSWVTMIDVRSGKMLRHTSVGLGLPLLTFDPRLDRVYVTGLIRYPTIVRPPFPRTPPLLVALNGATGSIAGTVRLGNQGHAIGVDARLDHLFVAGGGGGACMNHTCSADPSILTMLDAKTLKVLAVTPVGDSPQDDMLVDDRNGRVYVSAGNGIEVLDAGTAKHLLRIPLEARLLTVDIPTNRVFLMDTSGDLLLLDGHTSQVLSILPTSLQFGSGFPGTMMAVEPRIGHVYYAAAQASAQRGVSSGHMRLYEADGVTGHIVHSCAIAAQPTAVAAAPKNGLAIVTDYGTNTATVIRIAGCAVLQRIRVAPEPINIAVDEVHTSIVIESNTPQRPAARSGNAFASNVTTVTIAAL